MVSQNRLPDVCQTSHSDRKTGRIAWPGVDRKGVGRDSRMTISYSLGFRYLKQIQDLPPTGLPQMNLLEMYRLKDEMGSLR